MLKLSGNILGEYYEEMKEINHLIKQIPRNLKNFQLDYSYNTNDEFCEWGMEHFAESMKYLP